MCGEKFQFKSGEVEEWGRFGQAWRAEELGSSRLFFNLN
jgi:hypothetical protein